MKHKERILVGVVLAVCIISAIQALWNIDIAVSSLATHGTMISLTGMLSTVDYYHVALLRLFMSVSGIAIISVALLADNGGQP